LSRSTVLGASAIVLLLIATALTAAAAAPVRDSALAPSVGSPGPASHASVGLASGSSGPLGACHAPAGETGSTGVPAASPLPASGTTGPGPLFNNQVTPYAVLTGPYAYVAGGAALRDQGYGYINLTWPSGTLVAAYLIWSIIDNSVPSANASVNGHAISGTWTAYATPSPCWSPSYIYTFAADVTSYVANGANDITGIPSSVTTGADPWGVTQSAPLDDGASLVIVYAPATAPAIHEVTVYTGAEPIPWTGPNAQLNYSTTDGTSATTTYIVADGQLPGNEAVWNGNVIDTNAFPGSDPKQSSAAWSYGNLSDTKTYTVPVVLGSNNTTAQVTAPTSGDCLTWTGQVLSVQVPAKKGPYKVTFSEQGLNDGTSWNVTTNSTTHTGTVVNGVSNLQFTVKNGTYPYTVGTVPGYVATPSGSYRVAGGPVYIRVIFHQLLYSLNFTETGLPEDQLWWVQISNTTISFSDNLTADAPTNVSFLEGNASYAYLAGEEGLYHADPSRGTVDLHGNGVTVAIAFVPPPLYRVTVKEKGLPGGTNWGGSVSSNFGDYYNHTTNRSFSLELPNTTYSDTLYPYEVAGFASVSYVYFTVAGGPVTVTVNYTELYTVTLEESGLPVNTEWEAYLTNTSSEQSFSQFSTSAYLNISVSNGTTYTFTVDPVYAYVATPSTGPVEVTGANVTVHIVFSLAPTYAVVFTETGLSSGTKWSIEIYPPTYLETTTNSTGTTLTVYLPNGSYDFYPTAAHYEPSPTSGYFVVEGAQVNEPVAFTQLYPVTFEETGLPSGNYWTVYFDDTSNGSYSTSMLFYTPPGDFSFYAYDSGSFAPNVTSGSADVTSSGAVVQLAYSDPYEPTYLVTFSETGLPNLSPWWVVFNEYNESGTSTSLDFTEPNGSFDFTVQSSTGLAPNPSSGTLNVSGGPATQTIDFAGSVGSFAVTFTESGLPSGATWYANVTGQTGLVATVSGSSGTSVAIDLANGAYTYTANTSSRGWTSHDSGRFTVAGAALTESVSFTSGSTPTYAVTFTESGLAVGAEWYINISGQPSLSTSVSANGGTQLVTYLLDGSYTYSAASDLKNYTANGGQFSVAGSSQGISVPFSTSGTGPGTQHSTASPAPFPWVWAGIGIGVLVAFLLLLLLLARRRKKEQPPPPPVGGPATWSEPPPGNNP
jgi:hypothetical protein